ncbi:predicted protein [Chaetoceros tenuissimus]|uniref:Uncharacterized protein n=1 Tax=Chaetoceros tenuissimus TaxID=426638 RepID=A0AAD3H5C4_9STRA|nr:predicted protein [Chaetoceros tenuissimus]GFH43574.1 predicted protein [Chaetoceros tenuissimus]GFH50509.1 predicted protein [Chaetoceros tenuissimus]GFH50511.1 predicted protein [Chaetoceros tenuissimus]GFH50513.1 predicted protein [Chaetoceros tenuissimus]
MDCNKPLHMMCGIPIPQDIVNDDMHSNWCFECVPDISTTEQVLECDEDISTELTQMELEDPQPKKKKKKKAAKRRYKQVVASASLQQIDDNMTLDTVKKKNKDESMFYKHQLENVRFIVWLYKNEKYRDMCLVPDLVRDLHDKVKNQNYDQKFLRRSVRLNVGLGF